MKKDYKCVRFIKPEIKEHFFEKFIDKIFQKNYDCNQDQEIQEFFKFSLFKNSSFI